MAMTTQCAGPYQVTVTRGWAYPALMPKGTKTAVGMPGIRLLTKKLCQCILCRYWAVHRTATVIMLKLPNRTP